MTDGGTTTLQSDTPARRRELAVAAVAAVVSLLVLLGGAALRIAQRPLTDLDERIFLSVGRNLVDTGLPIDSYGRPGEPYLFFDHTPLYVYFVALVTAIGNNTILIVRASTLAFGLLTVLFVFLIGRQLRGVGSGLVGALLVAANPFF